MRKLVLPALLLCLFASSVFGQDVNNYQYVRVPERFDFLDENNQYQLNALTAFLFNKVGFDVIYIYKEPVPRGVHPCDMLYVNVHNESNMFRSKLYITLEDCNEQIVFKTKTGDSREKDYKTSYQEALRNAFESVRGLNYSYQGKVTDPKTSRGKEELKKKSAVDSIPAEVVVDSVITSKDRNKLRPSSEDNNNSFAGGYTNGAITYRLEKTPVGFDIYKSGEAQKFARLIKSGGGDNYLYSSKAVNGSAYFDDYGNLIVEYLDPESAQVISIIYRKDQ